MVCYLGQITSQLVPQIQFSDYLEVVVRYLKKEKKKKKKKKKNKTPKNFGFTSITIFSNLKSFSKVSLGTRNDQDYESCLSPKT